MITYDVRNSIEEAAGISGYSSSFIASVAHAESSYGTNTTNGDAVGLYQFTSPTWSDAVKAHGSKYPEIKAWDRNNNRHQGLMMGEHVKANASSLKAVLGRNPTEGELYGAHFIGRTGMKNFAAQQQRTPNASAATYFRAAARSNPWIFYNKDKTARSFTQVAQILQTKGTNAPGWNVKAPEPKAIDEIISGKPAIEGDKPEAVAPVPVDGSIPSDPSQPANEPAPVENAFSIKTLTQGKNVHYDGINKTFNKRIHSLLESMPPELRKSLKVTSGFRSASSQMEIIKRKLRKLGRPVTARALRRGIPGIVAGVHVDKNGVAVRSRSRHGLGEAFDIHGSKKAMAWLHANGPRFGVENPKSIRRTDPVHFQMVRGQLRGIDSQSIYTNAPPPPKPRQTRAQVEEQRMISREGRINANRSLIGDAMNVTHSYNHYFAGYKGMAPDPSWSPSEEEFKVLTKGIPEGYIDLFGEASSEDQAEAIRTFVLDKLESEKALQEAGITGTAARVFAAFTDPVDLGLILATEGLATPYIAGSKLGRVGQIMAHGSLGAASNVGIEGVHTLAGDPNRGVNDYLIAGFAGLALGGIYGAVAAPIRKEMDTIVDIAEQGAKDVKNMSMPGSGGAARVGSTPSFVSDEALEKLGQEGAAEGVGPRFDPAGIMSKSENPMARKLAAFGEDAVGKKGHALNPFSVSEDATKMYKQWTGDYDQMHVAQFDLWQRRKGYSGWQRILGIGRGEFDDSVTRYVRNKNAALVDTFDPEVAKVGQNLRKLNADALEQAKNPGRDLGTEYRPVKRFADVPADKHYMSRHWNGSAVRGAVEQFGETGFARLIRGSIQDAQPYIERALLDRLAPAFTKAITRRAHGLDDVLQRATLGDREALQRILSEHGGGLASKEIDEILDSIDRLRSGGSDAGTISRGKHRILLNESFEAKLPGRLNGELEHVRLHDYLVNDATALSRNYFRQMSGWIALSRFKAFDDKTGALLVDGITSRSEFEALVKKMKEKGADIKQPISQIEKDERQLRHMFDWITGNQKAPEGPVPDWLRVLRHFNFVRLLNQSGFAQIQEISATIGTVGWKASLMHMPALRRVVNMDGRAVLRHGFDEELEAAFGNWGNTLSGGSANRYDDLLMTHPGALHQGRTVDKINSKLEDMSKITATISGLTPITATLQRWTSKAVVQKFANLAQHPSKMSKGTLDRMKGLGISEEMLPKVLKEIDKNFTMESGTLFGQVKVKRINLDKWKNLEARAAFEGAVFRWTRKAIQENDVGSLGRWLSDPWVGLVFQFRTFMIGAYSKQLLHNLHMAGALGGGGSAEGARATTAYFAMSTVFGGAVYATQQNLAAIGRDDADEFLEKRLSPENIGKAAFSRTGFSSILPMLADTVGSGLFMTGDPIFDFRSSGQPASAAYGNPSFDLFDGIVEHTMRPLGDAVFGGRAPSQDEIRKMQRTFAPFGNFLPFLWSMNYMIGEHGGGFEQHTPRDGDRR